MAKIDLCISLSFPCAEYLSGHVENRSTGDFLSNVHYNGVSDFIRLVKTSNLEDESI